MPSDILVTNIGELDTMEPLIRAQRLHGLTADDLGRLHGAWLAVRAGKVVGYGTDTVPAAFQSFPQVDAAGKLVLPGLIDAHTHPVYAGNRAAEFCQRISGSTYQEIAAAGGGIKSTVAKTRAASTTDLTDKATDMLRRFLTHGVTTVEAKSGYGQSVASEIKLLQAIKQAAAQSPQTVVPTCLALHAMTSEYASKDAFVSVMTNELIPEVAQQKLAQYADAFIETGYFSVEDCEPFMQRARDAGMGLRVHADEFSDAGAAAAAARWEAASADHLECASEEGIAAMAQQGTVAILLPGTSLYTAIPYAQAERFRRLNCPIALATDYNPGSCQVDNLPFIATIGAIHCGLTLAETLGAVTLVPAHSLGLGASKGGLAVGYDGDFSIQSLGTAEEWVADLGRHQPNAVYCAGQLAYTAH